MSIVSTPFLFFFLPLSIGIYALIPDKKGMRLRNLFLLMVSLFFYAWGQPVFIFLLLLLILSVWLLGKMAEKGAGRTLGKYAVAMTVSINIGMLLGFKYLSFFLNTWGLLIGKDISFLSTPLPIGLSFFCFHAISYVVDIYRGQCKSPKSILNTALYLSVFFKMLQGPIVTYREFEPQIENRNTTWNDLREGIWRFAIGFGKKMIIASNIEPVVKILFSPLLPTLTMADAWIGCVMYLIFLYFDFSGYSDMAIGLGRMFGFKVPENFNYPYISTSISEYWRRWHITLIAWFRDYLYYPILLGPSVRFRKFLLRCDVNKQMAKTMQNIFVPACVWIVTALWHGTNWNYTIWGFVNCAAIVIEPSIKPLRNKRLNTFIRWLGIMLLLMLMVPLINTENLETAIHYQTAMFAGTGVYTVSVLMKNFLQMSGLFLAIGIIGCFPIVPFIKRKIFSIENQKIQVIWDIAEFVFLVAVVIISLSYVHINGAVWFMYQQ